jgi:hypothetical protein
VGNVEKKKKRKIKLESIIWKFEVNLNSRSVRQMFAW